MIMRDDHRAGDDRFQQANLGFKDIRFERMCFIRIQGLDVGEVSLHKDDMAAVELVMTPAPYYASVFPVQVV